MRRKDIKEGMRVKPSGNGGTRRWRNLEIKGTVTRIDSEYIYVHWEDMEEPEDKMAHLPIELRDANEFPFDTDDPEPHTSIDGWGEHE